MKKNLMFLLAFLFITINAKAESIWMSAAQIVRGEAATAEVYLDNPSSVISGFQFDLTLPEGVTPVTSSTGAVTVTASSRLGSSYTLKGRRQNGNTYRFLYLSTSGAGISSNSGRVFSISLTASETAPCGNCEATVSNVTLTKKDGTEITPTATNFNISLAHSLAYTEGKFPTCTEDGHEEYWHCALCNKYFSDESGVYETTLEDLAKPAMGHLYDFENICWTWNIGWTECTAELLCLRCNHSVSSPATVTIEDTTPATHTHAGVRTYTATAILLGKEYTNVKTEEIPVTGHTYGAPTWYWDGYSSATATFTCDGGDDTQVLTATITPQIIAATCETNGQRIYTASVKFNGTTYTDTRTEEISATGHAYDFDHIKWDWNGYSSATATFTCKNGDDSQVVTATVTSEVKKPATCQYPGTRTYTASVTFQNHVYSDVKLEVIPATGDHTYGEPVWTWTGYTAAVANFSCTSGDSSVNVEAVITSELVLAATCDAAGSKKYTATATFNNKEYTDVVTEDLAALGHSYGEPIWTWSDDGKTASAKIVCIHDANHVVEAQAEVTRTTKEPASCTEMGVTRYIATVTLNGTVYNSYKDVQDIPVTDHVFIAQYNGDGTHTLTCALCGLTETEHCTYENGVCTVCGAEEPVAEEDTDISQYENIIYSEHFETVAGVQAIIPIKMKNNMPITGFQFDVILPTGVSYVLNNKGKPIITLADDRKAEGHNISSNVIDGNLRVIVAHMSNDTFSGNDGDVLYITIQTAEDMVAKDYSLVLSKIEMTNPNNSKAKVEKCKSTFTIADYKLGDVNKDNDITISDVVGIINFVIEANTEGLNRKAADVNGDMDVTITDVVMTINMVIGNTPVQSNTVAPNTSLCLSGGEAIEGREFDIPVILSSEADVIAAMQFDVTLPAGLELVGINSDDNHQVVFNESERGVYRIASVSFENDVYSGNGSPAVSLKVKSNSEFVGGNVKISSIEMTDVDENTVRPADVTAMVVAADATYIDDITATNESNEVYDVAGRRVKNTRHGFYVVNGKKVYKNK